MSSRPKRKSLRPRRTIATKTQKLSGNIRYAFRYLLSLPEGYSAKRQKRWPLLFFFHGRGERGDSLSTVELHGPPKLIAQGQALPFVVVSPQCELKDYWWDYGALDAFVAKIIRRYRVDPDRVYLTGLSMGGFATWTLAQQAPERYAAIVPVCGGGDVRFAIRLRDLPVWAFHGADDATIPARRTTEMIEGINAAGGSPRATIYPGVGHDSWTKTYENPAVYEWLLSHRRKHS